MYDNKYTNMCDVTLDLNTPPHSQTVTLS